MLVMSRNDWRLELPEYSAQFLSKLLRRAREDKELTQQQAADAVGEHRTMIARMELGQVEDPKFALVAKLAFLYNLDLNEVAASAGLPIRGKVSGPEWIDNARLRIAVEHLMKDPDHEWKENVITTLYMLVMSKTQE